MASIEKVDEEYIFTDSYGAKLIVVPFEHHEGEKWVHIYSDSPDGVVQEMLEEYDEGLNVPLWMLELFTQFVIKNEEGK